MTSLYLQCDTIGCSVVLDRAPPGNYMGKPFGRGTNWTNADARAAGWLIVHHRAFWRNGEYHPADEEHQHYCPACVKASPC